MDELPGPTRNISRLISVIYAYKARIPLSRQSLKLGLRNDDHSCTELAPLPPGAAGRMDSFRHDTEPGPGSVRHRLSSAHRGRCRDAASVARGRDDQGARPGHRKIGTRAAGGRTRDRALRGRTLSSLAQSGRRQADRRRPPGRNGLPSEVKNGRSRSRRRHLEALPARTCRRIGIELRITRSSIAGERLLALRFRHIPARLSQIRWSLRCGAFRAQSL